MAKKFLKNLKALFIIEEEEEMPIPPVKQKLPIRKNPPAKKKSHQDSKPNTISKSRPNIPPPTPKPKAKPKPTPKLNEKYLEVFFKAMQKKQSRRP